MMRFVDMLYSIPFIFVVIFLITILGQEQIKAELEAWGIDRITIFYFVVGAIYWLTMARVVRGQVISLRTEPFVEAARAVGASQSRIIVRHILPNLVEHRDRVSHAHDSARDAVRGVLVVSRPGRRAARRLVGPAGERGHQGDHAGENLLVADRVPAAALGITLYALNFLGDGLRDALDPKLASR